MTSQFRDLQIDEAVQAYFDVLYTCDLSLFDRLFHPSCHLFTVANGGETVLSAASYREILRNRESPKSQGATREESVLGLQILSPEIALVQVRVRVGTKVFRDHLHFLRSKDGWRIAAKLYTLEAAP